MVVFMPINYILFHSGKYGASIVNSPGVIHLSTLPSVNMCAVMRKEDCLKSAADFHEGTNTLVLYNFKFVCIYVCLCACVYKHVHVCMCVLLHKCIYMCVYIRFFVDRITRSSRVIKMVVLSRTQYNDKEVKNSTIGHGCMLFLYH